MEVTTRSSARKRVLLCMLLLLMLLLLLAVVVLFGWYLLSSDTVLLRVGVSAAAFAGEENASRDEAMVCVRGEATVTCGNDTERPTIKGAIRMAIPASTIPRQLECSMVLFRSSNDKDRLSV